jgi:uncharacterized protein YbjT (DUF2867 family)
MTAHRNAARNAWVGKVLYLSTIGAQAPQTNLLSQHTVGESVFSELDTPVTYLRPAWFLENISWDIDSARGTGVIHSFLSPLNKPFPMVAVDDISHVAAELLQEQWESGRPQPEEVTENATLQAILGRRYHEKSVIGSAQEGTVDWCSFHPLIKSQSMKNSSPKNVMVTNRSGRLGRR